MGLDIVELVMELDTAFDVKVWIDLEKEPLTVGFLYDHVVRQVAPDQMSPAGGPYAGELWERYLDVVGKQIDVHRDRLRPDARFVQDLGVN